MITKKISIICSIALVATVFLMHGEELRKECMQGVSSEGLIIMYLGLQDQSQKIMEARSKINGLVAERNDAKARCGWYSRSWGLLYSEEDCLRSEESSSKLEEARKEMRNNGLVPLKEIKNWMADIENCVNKRAASESAK